jgi:hypothetical protein
MRFQFVGDAMLDRIFSKLSGTSYETILGLCAVCYFVSLFLAATI